MHVHVGRKKRHAVQPSVRCCLPAKGTSPKYSSTLSVDMLLSDRDTLDKEPLDASNDPPAGNCSRSSSVSVSMSRDLRLYTYWQTSATWRSDSFSPACELRNIRSYLLKDIKEIVKRVSCSYILSAILITILDRFWTSRAYRVSLIDL